MEVQPCLCQLGFFNLVLSCLDSVACLDVILLYITQHLKGFAAGSQIDEYEVILEDHQENESLLLQALTSGNRPEKDKFLDSFI
jgi:hypothetical protein